LCIDLVGAIDRMWKGGQELGAIGVRPQTVECTRPNQGFHTTPVTNSPINPCNPIKQIFKGSAAITACDEMFNGLSADPFDAP
jgi:hypothetical protein